jgi:hypothetical protein
MMPAVFARGPGEPSAAEPAAESVRVDEVRERGLAVQLDDGDPLAVTRLERGVAADVDELDVVAADLAHDLERTLAEVAAGSVEENDSVARGRAHA